LVSHPRGRTQIEGWLRRMFESKEEEVMGGSNKELHNLSYSLNKHYYYNQIRII
jgi:hypothetical protein